MKKRSLLIAAIALTFSSFTFCSSDSGDDDENNVPMGTVPQNNDSGKNNDKNPDNVTGGGTTNPGGGSGNGGNTGSGGDNGSGDNSGSGDNNGSDSGSSSIPTWQLVFEDDFEGDSSTPDPKYWSLAKKGDDRWNRYMSESYNQAYQKDGYLYLFGMESDGKYYCGGIETVEKYYFKYGQLKCRARFLRHPQGNHTGIWMMPQPGLSVPTQKWPKSGEIDIMEHLNSDDIVYETVHFWNDTDNSDDKQDKTASIDIEEFNTYGVIWDEESVSFTVNGDVKFTYKNENPGNENFSYQYPFTEPFYIILSQSLGGEGTWEGPINNSQLPAIFQIDWIKVWQKN